MEKRLLVILYFLCYFKHKNVLWQNYDLSLEQVVVPRVLRSLGVAAEAKGDRARLQDWHPEPRSVASETSLRSHGACGVKSGREETAFSNFRFDFPLSSGLGLEKKNPRRKKKEEKVYPGRR